MPRPRGFGEDGVESDDLVLNAFNEFEAIVQGKMHCTIECNPLLGPQFYDLVEQVVAGISKSSSSKLRIHGMRPSGRMPWILQFPLESWPPSVTVMSIQK